MLPLDPIHEQHLRLMREDVEAFLSACQVEIDSSERNVLQALNAGQLSHLLMDLATASRPHVEACFHDSMIAYSDPTGTSACPGQSGSGNSQQEVW